MQPVGGVDEKYNKYKELLNNYIVNNKSKYSIPMDTNRVAEYLNLATGSGPDDVIAKIASLKNEAAVKATTIESLNNKLTASESALVTAKADLENRANQIAQLTNELSETKRKYTELTNEKSALSKTNEELIASNQDLRNKVTEYENKVAEAEQKEKAARSEALVNQFIEDGVIPAESKDGWIEMANANFKNTETLLNSLPKAPTSYNKVPKAVSAEALKNEANLIDDINKKGLENRMRITEEHLKAN